MSYDCIVCVKQVPDTSNITGEAMKEDGTVNRAALPAVFNPEDLNSLEAALQVREKYGGTVTAITMGPLNAAEVLRECLYRGADRAILITDGRPLRGTLAHSQSRAPVAGSTPSTLRSTLTTSSWLPSGRSTTSGVLHESPIPSACHTSRPVRAFKATNEPISRVALTISRFL